MKRKILESTSKKSLTFDIFSIVLSSAFHENPSACWIPVILILIFVGKENPVSNRVSVCLIMLLMNRVAFFPSLSKVCCQAHLYHWIYSSYQLSMYLKTHGVSSESKSLLILFFKPWPVSTLAWFIYLGFRFN